MATKTDELTKTQLTQDGYDEIVKELKELEDVKLPSVILRVETARQYGDLSENAEYHSAKEDQELTETRIMDLQTILANSTIVKQTGKTSSIGMGSHITAQMTQKSTKKKVQLQMVGEYEADPKAGKISTASPIGKAMLGKKKGDVVEVQTPAGVTSYEIIEIK